MKTLYQPQMKMTELSILLMEIYSGHCSYYRRRLLLTQLLQVAYNLADTFVGGPTSAAIR